MRKSHSMWPEHTEAKRQNYIEKRKRQKSRIPRFREGGEVRLTWALAGGSICIYICWRMFFRFCFSLLKRVFWAQEELALVGGCALTAFHAPPQVTSLSDSLVDS